MTNTNKTTRATRTAPNPRAQAARLAITSKDAQSAADYADALQTETERKLTHEIDQLRKQIAKQDEKLSSLTSQLHDLSGQLTLVTTDQSREDRFALTKARLVRLMRDLGYYEDEAPR